MNRVGCDPALAGSHPICRYLHQPQGSALPRNTESSRVHVVATLPGGRKKWAYNKTADDALATVVRFLQSGTMAAKWGNKQRTYQALELRVYETSSPFHKPSGGSLEDFVKGKRNVFKKYERRAQKLLGQDAYRVFVVMPIQGEEYGSQDEQRIYSEYDKRFEVIEKLLADHGCVAIRIDKEFPLDGLVGEIQKQINQAAFVIADLTDERPSCYYEVGYADALRKPVIHVASKQSVIDTKKPTRIHFDIHKSVHFFTNHSQLVEKLRKAIEKNWEQLTDA